MPIPSSLARLVDEFVTTMRRHGIGVDRHVVELEMRARVAEIAERLRVDPQTVLREHVREGWGEQMAAPVIEQIRRQGLLRDGDTQPAPAARHGADGP